MLEVAALVLPRPLYSTGKQRTRSEDRFDQTTSMLDSMFASRDTDSVVWRKRSSLNLSLSHAAQTGGGGTVPCHAMQHDLRLSIGQDILEPRNRTAAAAAARSKLAPIVFAV